MSRIGYVGNFEPEFSTENDVRKAFESLGHEVIKLQEDKIDWQTLRQVALQSDLLLWTSTWDSDRGGQPLDKTIETLRLCALRGVPTATLHLDIFFGSDRGDRNWLANPMFFTSHVFTADGDHQAEWAKIGVNHTWLRPGVRHDAAHFGNFRDEYACDVAFVGSNGQGYHDSVWPYRKQLLNAIREMCDRNGWKFRNPGGEPDMPNWGKVERGEDLNDFYASAKITVGDSLCLKKEASHYWSDRVPEATGRGGLLIMPQIDQLILDYAGVIPTYPWGEFDKLEEMIGNLLPNDQLQADIKRACQTTTHRDHTYVNRAKEILVTVGVA